MLHSNMTVNQSGHLCFGGLDTLSLAEKHGTPLYLADGDRIRENCRVFTSSMKKYFKNGGTPLFASKAFSARAIYEIIASEGMGTDIVSGGELAVAKKAGFPLEKAFFHGNAKSVSEITAGIEAGIGHFVVDNLTELDRISKIASEKGINQKILLRLTPGIDPHTFDAVNTGRVDSKFGFPIVTGQAREAVCAALEAKGVSLLGFHCHIGSQIFEVQPFIDAAAIMLEFIAEMKKAFGFEAGELNLGGGFGVRYVESDPGTDIENNIKRLGEFCEKRASELKIALPHVFMEPGRSIVADAGMTLYTVENVKVIPDYKNFVAIDGGMTDNPRFALYRSEYTVLSAARVNETPDFVCTLAGKCCESGDLIAEEISLPSPKVGDVIAVAVTGAYNYSMASNYNATPRPPVVLLSQGKDTIAVRRETPDDFLS